MTPPVASRDVDQEIADAKARIALLEDELQHSWKTIASMHKEIHSFTMSHGWRLLSRYYKVRNFLLPIGSFRHRLVAKAFHGLSASAKFLVKQVLLGFWSRDSAYRNWMKKYEPTEQELEEQRRAKFAYEPLISVVVPTYNTPVPVLKEMIQSVIGQTYARWQLCIADGASSEPEFKRTLENFARAEPRIRLRWLAENQGIAGNSNAGLELAEGDFIAFLDHDDTLAPFALHEVVRAINAQPEADFFYSDEDKIDEEGKRRFDPHFKPDWSPDTLRSHNYICHLAVYRHDLMHQVGGFRAGYDGSQDYDLILRATEKARAIVHIPKILYHWRVGAGSTAGDHTAKMYAYVAARKALASHLERSGISAPVEKVGVRGTYRIRYPLPSQPLVSIIIPTQDQAKVLKVCLDSLNKNTYQNVEIILIENHSTEPATFALYQELTQRPNLRLLTWTKEFNYASVNNFAAQEARGEILLFLNNDMEVITPDWIEEMLCHALRPGVGVVGAKLYFPDGKIQHGGVILGMRGIADHAHRFEPRESIGYQHRLIATQNLSAVTGACMMMRADLFRKLGGFDERFVLAFNDIDLCLKARAEGYLVVWTPFAELYHHESKTRGLDISPTKFRRLQNEISVFQSKWGKQLVTGDPYYNPNLTLDSENFGVRS